MNDFAVAVISKGRPENAAVMAPHLATFDHVRWFVPVNEMSAYKAAGVAVVPDGGGLCAGRNEALYRAFARGLDCVQVSDDLRGVKSLYAYTLDHILTYGGAARCDYIAPSFSHRSNPGGAVSVRTPELEQESIAYLKAMYPGLVRDNPRRPNEILLKTFRGAA